MALDKKVEDGSEVKIELTSTELKSLLRIQKSADEHYGEDEIDLSELWQGLMNRKILIISVTLLVAVAAVLFAFKATPKYEATVVLVPVSSEGGASGLLAKYGGLASMAGITLPSGSEGISQSEEALAILMSYRFLSEYIQEKKLKQVLFYKRWDMEYQRWMVKKGVILGLKKTLFSSKNNHSGFSYEGKEVLLEGEPSMTEAVALFKKNIFVSEDSKTGLIHLKLSWVNPVQAKNWANELVQRVDDELRQKSIVESQGIMDYMQQKLPSIVLQDLRMIALKMMEEQVKKITFAEVNKAHVFKVIDPAIVAETPVSPKKGLIVSVGFVLGLMLSIFMALILNWREGIKK